MRRSAGRGRRSSHVLREVWAGPWLGGGWTRHHEKSSKEEDRARAKSEKIEKYVKAAA